MSIAGPGFVIGDEIIDGGISTRSGAWLVVRSIECQGIIMEK